MKILAVRLDSDGDVLLAGPAIRALAAAGSVTLLCGPRGRQAAELLPGVDDVVVWRCPWIEAAPDAVDPVDVDALVTRLRTTNLDEAVVFTSFHQSALPTALLLRLAGIRRISAISEDYPGALLDVRHRVDDSTPALTEITLNRLSHTQVEQIVTDITDGKTVPQEVLQQILVKTDGMTAFREEMTKAILESGHLKDTDGHYALTGSLSTFAIPATLQDLADGTS